MPKSVGSLELVVRRNAKSLRMHKSTYCHLRPGITILEILIGLVILSVVSLFIYYIFSSQLGLYIRQIVGIGVSSQNKIALDDITNQTRQAESIVTTCPNPPCDPTEVGTTPTSVVYRLWSLDSSGNPTSSSYDYVVYKQVGTNLKRIVYPNTTLPSTRPASDDVIATDLDTASGLTFSYNNDTPTLANQVTVTVTTIKTEGGKTQKITQSARAKIRNQGTDKVTVPLPINYAMFSNNSISYFGNIVTGNIHTNGFSITTAGQPNTVFGNASSLNTIDSNLTVTGTKTENAPHVNSPDLDYNYWKTQANGGNDPATCPPASCTTNCDLTGVTNIGPKKYDCDDDMTISSGTITVDGPIWITNRLTLSGTAELKLNSNFGSYGTVVLATSKITLRNSAKITPTPQKGYLLMTTDSTPPGGLMDFFDGAIGEAVFISQNQMTLWGTFTGHLTAIATTANLLGTTSFQGGTVTYDPVLSSYQLISSPL